MLLIGRTTHILTVAHNLTKTEMKIKIFPLCLIMSCGIYAQNVSIENERYGVINALYKNISVEKNGQVELDKYFYKFLGLGAIISQPDFIDNLWGHCIDIEKRETYSFSEIISSEEISKMRDQVAWFLRNPIIDSTKVSDKIKIVNDIENNKTALSIPLIYNNKAILYLTNKNNQETLIVLVKENNEWVVRCRKYLYLRLDD